MAPTLYSPARPARPAPQGRRGARPAPTTAPTPGPATTSARRAGGPQDRALYSCNCGHAFKASVSTSVGCPHCGTRQAW